VTEPIVISPVLMKDIGDCAVCCLSMLTGVSYADVIAACPKRARPFTDGLSVKQTCAVAKRLGFELEYHTFEDDEEAGVGILVLERTYHDPQQHMVVYAKGTVIHPGDGCWYTDLDAYLKKYNWRVEGFLWRK
jgi:hypothetical protein